MAVRFRLGSNYGQVARLHSRASGGDLGHPAGIGQDVSPADPSLLPRYARNVLHEQKFSYGEPVLSHADAGHGCFSCRDCEFD